MPKNEMPWRDAIETILKASSEAMHYTDISNRIIERKLRTKLGATPASTVSAFLTTGIKNEGHACPFKKVGRGLYLWSGKETVKKVTTKSTELPSQEEESSDEQNTIISSFGMFWRRAAVEWKQNPSLLGMQEIGAEPVDFSKQLGVYLLYDGREVIYVGRATERALGRRLYEHTSDRLATRWDRFSWFGFLPVSENGTLGNLPDAHIAKFIIPTIEAVLIEALEPRQNRKRGDDLTAVEFMQKEDPSILKKLHKQQLFDAIEKLG
jgi:hypothetical protein